MRKAGVRINTAGSKINKASIFNPNAAWNHNQRLTHTDNKKVDVDVELLNFMNPGETFLTKTKDYEKLYKMKTGQNVQKKAMPLREMIINTDKHVTMQNLAYLTQKIEKLTGWKALHIAHHKDEGHFDKDTGIFKTNYHAHVVWECYDKETAKSKLLSPKQMSTLQDLASIHLSMERGEKNSNKIHLEPEQYRQQQTIIETIKIQSEKKISKAVENIEEHLAFAGSNEQPYQSVGRWLLDRGLIRDASWQGIKAWIVSAQQSNPRLVQEMLWSNPRYVFFREEVRSAADADLGPRGAQGVPLTAGRSIAVDKDSIPYGTPVWLASAGPNGSLQRLVFAQDTGSAIVGAVRADYFAGTGAEAGDFAGRMKQGLRLWVLWPR